MFGLLPSSAAEEKEPRREAVGVIGADLFENKVQAPSSCERERFF